VLVGRVGRHRLIALEPLAEIVRADQTALQQKIEGAIHGCRSHPLTLLPELAADRFHREVVFREKDDLGHQVALAGDWLVVLAEVTAKALE
jgi:hypothetical protein